jgi:hypothetical protein
MHDISISIDPNIQPFQGWLTCGKISAGHFTTGYSNSSPLGLGVHDGKLFIQINI